MNCANLIGEYGAAASAIDIDRLVSSYILSIVSWPMYVIDRTGKILWDSAATHAPSFEPLGYYVEAQGLRHKRADIDSAIANMIAAFGEVVSELVVTPKGSIRPSVLHMRALPGAPASNPLILIIIRFEPEFSPSHRALLIRTLAITETEVDILLDLMRGVSIKDMCAKRGVQEGTVRWHIKNLIRKTGTRGQRPLLRLAFRVIPPFN